MGGIWLALLGGAWGAFAVVTAAAAEPCAPVVARVVSLQGTVEVQAAAADRWAAVGLDHELCLGDTLRVGALGRAAVALPNDSVLRVDQRTTLRFAGAGEGGRSLLDLLRGAVHFFSRRPRALEIETPIANAGTEGTEFLLRAGAARTEVVMLEGRVRLATAAGELWLASGEAADATAGAAPRPQIVARPRDAVAWALYYPPVLAPLAAGEARGLPSGLEDAVRRVAAGDHAGALAALDAVPAAARDARWHSYRAGVLLGVGRADEAAAALEQALAREPESAAALAQRAVLALTRGRREEALADARRALVADPGSAPAAIALSYALQAAFELEAARAVLREAATRSPGDPLAWARLAELELSFGALGAAQAAAERAVALAPDLARTQMVLGFAALSRIDIDAARAAFERAIALDSALPLARLGLGLAKIRRGLLEAGRRELEIAVALDPDSSLLRSYLGKAYFEERRGPLDADQLQIAKELDPNDPTPWLYDAIRKQSENRPVEALRDLETSIVLNDNRAVFRSRLLLDEDLAARGARLGRIYNDLGFEQLALVEGTRSTDRDPGNHAAHRLLADSYAVLPRHQIARDSELLQSQLLQPLNTNPVQPALAGDRLSGLGNAGPSEVGLTEFSQLFASNGLRFHGDVVVGSQDTIADNVIFSGIHDQLSFSLGQYHAETDGFRDNNDQNVDAVQAFGQVSLSPRTSIQAEARRVESDSGDRTLRFDADEFFEEQRVDGTSDVIRLGLRHDFAPGATTLLSYMYRDTVDETDQGSGGFALETDQDAHFGELRHLQRWGRFDLTAGVGHFEGNSTTTGSFAGAPVFTDKSNLHHTNGYGYLSAPIADATLTVGLSADDFQGVLHERSQVNPKVGLTWDVTPETTLRAAAFRVLKRSLVADQTLEPTNVAGFNQFFDDVNGSDVWRYGAAVDQKLGRDLFFGVEYSERQLDVPTQTFEAVPEEFTVEEEEHLGRAYLYWTPTDRWAMSLEYRYETFDFDSRGTEPRGLTQVDTHTLPLAAHYFHPQGFFAGARLSYVNQSASYFDIDQNERDGHDSFLIFDAMAGYRFPGRRGIFSIEVDNLFDAGFNYVDSDRDRVDIARDRAVLARLTLEFW